MLQMLQCLNIFKKHNFLLSSLFGITLLLSPSHTHASASTTEQNKFSALREVSSKIIKWSGKIVSYYNLIQSVFPIIKLARAELLVRTIPTVPLSACKTNFADILSMTRQMNIDANEIPMYLWNQVSPAVGRSFTRDILFIPSINKVFSKGECHFTLGHELAHIAHKHVLKRFLLAIIAPLAIRAGLTIFHKLAKKGLQAIRERYEPAAGSWLDKTLKTTNKAIRFVSRNPFMEALYINRLCTYYSRSQEKEADLESARIFNTAEQGVSFMQSFDKINKQAVSPTQLRIHEFFDEHPTYVERIAYLRPLAEAQKRQAKLVNS